MFMYLTYRRVRRRSHGADHTENLVALDQPAVMLHCLWWRIAVVEADQLDLAAVYPALLVDHGVVRGLGAALGAVRRQWTAVGIGLPDQDFRVGRTRTIFALGICGNGSRQQQQGENEAFHASNHMMLLTAEIDDGMTGEPLKPA
jgi:hypothetical protein